MASLVPSLLTGTLTRRFAMVMGKLPMNSVALNAREKLVILAGPKPFKEQDRRIRSLCSWRDKAASAVRHMLRGDRKLSPDEVQDIEAAHLKHCAKTIEANRAENRKLYESLSAALAAMQASDPEFFSQQADAVREILFRYGDGNSGDGSEV
jgi:hypothetical protein